LLMCLSLWSPALTDDLIGQASVIDGDTIEIHGTRIRLWGIDAPESTQLCRGEDSLQYRCGAKAANDLDAFIARRPVNCTPMNLDQYGRTVATCSVGDADLGEWLVHNGLALDWPRFSKGGMKPINATQNLPGAASGTAVTLNPGCIEPAFDPREVPPAVRTTQTRILRTEP
jgi:endonuclease YncB( thermonuclease family)